MPPIVFFLWPVSTEMYRGCTSVAEVTVMRRVRKSVAHNKKNDGFPPLFFFYTPMWPQSTDGIPPALAAHKKGVGRRAIGTGFWIRT